MQLQCDNIYWKAEGIQFVFTFLPLRPGIVGKKNKGQNQSNTQKISIKLHTQLLHPNSE